MKLTKDHYSLLRDALGTGIAGKVPTRNELSLYMLGQFPKQVQELVDAGLLERQFNFSLAATEAGRTALLNLEVSHERR